MELLLKRTIQKDNAILGELFVNNFFFCYTLEDVIRDVKIKHETCISSGRYEMILSVSNKFKVLLPLLLNVPEFEGIRIHAGNTNKDTSGCILVGTKIKGDSILNSRIALNKLMSVLTVLPKKEKIYITIENPIIEEPIEEINEVEIIEVSQPPLEIEIPEKVIKQNKFLIFINKLIKWFKMVFSFKKS